MDHIVVDGVQYPVTSNFQTEVLDTHPDLITKTYEAMEAEKNSILRRSTDRWRGKLKMPISRDVKHPTLTPEEALRLECLVHVLNAHHGVNFLQGRLHTDFGFSGVDQVHGNSAPQSCGCIHTYVFDHYQRHDPDVKLHPHHPRHVCNNHAR